MELKDRLQQALGAGYTLEREIEGGGMSRVFVARDTTLKREIVVKLLRPELLTGVSVERFEREILLAARLQHPHIVPLLFAGTVAPDADAMGVRLPFFTMPFIRGESLRTRLGTSAGLPISETIHVLRDIASALAHAHGEGVVHRDIKPENVMLSGGVAVVTDFGVAKAVKLATTAGDTRRALTSVGLTLGTPAYMSPEQASADPEIDHRADIYSFGCVAYEMLSGESPFGNRPPQQTLAAHVTETPPSLEVREPGVPAALAALVMRCLAKLPDDRPQSADELLTALDAISTPRAAAHSHRGLALSAIVAVAAAVVLLVRGLGGPEGSFVVESTRLVTSAPELEVDPAISPDGKLVAYASGPLFGMRIYVRQLAGGPAVMISGAQPGDHRWPRWSPDGEQILFADRRADSSAAYVVPYVGGTPRLVVSEAGSGAITTPAWSADGTQIAYGDQRQGGAIVLQSMAGGVPSQLVPGSGLHSPAFSPDGRRLAYVSGNVEGQTVLNIAASSIWVVAIPGGKPVRLTDSTHSNTGPVWTPDGESLLFISDLVGEKDIYQQRVGRNGEPVGEPVRLTTGRGAFGLSLAADGSRAVYSVLRLRSQVWQAPIAPARPTPLSDIRLVTRDAQAIEGLDVSRDGKWLAYDSNRGGNQDIYKVLVDGGEPIQLTSDPAPDFVPQWSPDGREIAYYSLRAGNRDIRVMNAEGRDDRAVTSTPEEELYPTWSRDGQALAFVSFANRRELAMVSRDARGEWSHRRQLRPESGDSGEARFPRWSPDGQWIAYVAGTLQAESGSRGGETLILVSPTGGKSRTLIGGGELGGRIRFAAWGPDPRVVFVHVYSSDGAASFWSVPLSGGAPRLLLAVDDPARSVRRQEFSTDGRRLFFTLAADESDVWVMELKRSR
jgi:Tol biopolymer transport system component/tRNA A-37 threonylcarbamoyl transferase component Bud32